jgi:hypothetical protein
MSRGLPERYRVDEVATRHQERALCFIVDRICGAEIRPTRVFFWLGSRRPGQEMMMSLDSPPRLLRSARRRHIDLGGLHLSFLGNPMVTLGLFGARAARRAWSGRGGQAPAA